jgi:hypothetical protein
VLRLAISSQLAAPDVRPFFLGLLDELAGRRANLTSYIEGHSVRRSQVKRLMKLTFHLASRWFDNPVRG